MKEAAKDRLLDVAERLFAERGYEAAGVRDITTEAGVNLSAVNYHFGGKEGLYVQVIGRVLAEMRRRSAEATDAVLAHAGASAEALLVRYARAFLRAAASDPRTRQVMRLFLRELTDPHPEVGTLEFGAGSMESLLADALRRVLPGLGRSDARLAAGSVLSQVIHFICKGQYLGTLESGRAGDVDLDRVADHIVRFSAAGLYACAAAVPQQESTP